MLMWQSKHERKIAKPLGSQDETLVQSPSKIFNDVDIPFLESLLLQSIKRQLRYTLSSSQDT